jgi:hypothetical protein
VELRSVVTKATLTDAFAAALKRTGRTIQHARQISVPEAGRGSDSDALSFFWRFLETERLSDHPSGAGNVLLSYDAVGHFVGGRNVIPDQHAVVSGIGHH